MALADCRQQQAPGGGGVRQRILSSYQKSGGDEVLFLTVRGVPSRGDRGEVGLDAMVPLYQSLKPPFLCLEKLDANECAGTCRLGWGHSAPTRGDRGERLLLDRCFLHS